MAIASLDSVHQYLSLFLVDVVSGQMVHSARLAKATAPVHLVNCEHWVAVSGCYFLKLVTRKRSQAYVSVKMNTAARTCILQIVDSHGSFVAKS